MSWKTLSWVLIGRLVLFAPPDVSAFHYRHAAYTDDLIVDLGYAKYQGYHNDTFDMDIWRGLVQTFRHTYSLLMG